MGTESPLLSTITPMDAAPWRNAEPTSGHEPIPMLQRICAERRSLAVTGAEILYSCDDESIYACHLNRSWDIGQYRLCMRWDPKPDTDSTGSGWWLRWSQVQNSSQPEIDAASHVRPVFTVQVILTESEPSATQHDTANEDDEPSLPPLPPPWRGVEIRRPVPCCFRPSSS
jgi:hypothetical protein